jgi:hypothetical protein
MILDALIFLIYLAFFIWAVNQITFFKKSRLTRFWLTFFFLLKLAAGIAYGIFHTTLPNYPENADTWKFFYDSLDQKKLLLQHPIDFFLELFESPYEKKFHHFFSIRNSFWNDLRHVYMVKLVAMMNLFSGSRYYVNVIFYEFLTFFGVVGFIRVMKDIFKGKLAIIAGTTFLIPSFVFWTSGIHKDGIVFTVISLISFHLYFYFKGERSRKSVLYAALLLLILFPLRNYVVLALIPAITAWAWSFRIKNFKWLPFVLVALTGSLVFFSTKYINPKIDLPISVVLRNKEFTALGGNSVLPNPALKPNFWSFIINAPNALNHTLARPYLNEVVSYTYFFSAIEIIFFWLIVFIWFFKYNENPYRHQVVMFLMMTSFTVLLLTGYIVPQIGAIVRYRSVYLPFIIVPIMCSIRWKKTH